ncbi:hypothetical protein [Planomicrobium sp. CPCC 101110]|uniref:hypothetical protein n=1 Tax=Planomicrobium sp. CPCC 101110 TaxID=2599619 RepID=UPI0011B498D0|nr:hypothetical protein [Planomicrobium sp. CPCC 101110]TWT27866.1 hypothetical protein FQV30_05000 [Planomicrobium sp. CPCC 101110]
MDDLEDFVEYRSGLTSISVENLQALAKYYDFGSVEEMEEFLNGFDDSIEYYQSIKALEGAISIYLSFGEDAEFILDGLFFAFGLTEEELDKIERS